VTPDPSEPDERLRLASLELLAAWETLSVRANLDRAADLLGTAGGGSG
jgi:hypothetical protein